MELPIDFVEQMQMMLGPKYKTFVEALEEPAPRSLRLNPRKLNGKPGLRQVPWSSQGYYVKKNTLFTLDPTLHAGGYYVQEPSSMFLEQALSQLLDLKEPCMALDLCAAPGGKSTLLASLLSDDSLIVANEVIKPRARTLAENVTKWGQANILVSNNDPADFRALPGFFDAVIVDAPCSGEGLFRKDPEAIKEWSVDHVQHCCERQQRILGEAWQTLRPGGLLIYSTCTYNLLENEENLYWLAETFGVESQRLRLNPNWQVEESEVNQIYGYRFYPHLVKGEGFFLAALRKPENAETETVTLHRKHKLSRATASEVEPIKDWIKNPDRFAYVKHQDKIKVFTEEYLPETDFLYKHLHIIHGGVELAEWKKNDAIPQHELALFTEINKDAFDLAELSLEEALRYLRKDEILPGSTQNGWNLLSWQGLTLGFGKKVGQRMNNYYPTDWRIRMELSEHMKGAKSPWTLFEK